MNEDDFLSHFHFKVNNASPTFPDFNTVFGKNSDKVARKLKDILYGYELHGETLSRLVKILDSNIEKEFGDIVEFCINHNNKGKIDSIDFFGRKINIIFEY